jgi:hypothetical protein
MRWASNPDRTQANNCPDVETKPRQFESRPEALEMMNQKQIPSYANEA